MSEKAEKMLPVLEVLRRAESYFKERGVSSPRLSAECLLAKILGIDRLGLYLNFDRPLIEKELEAYRKLVRRRGAHEPLQYILGSTSFRRLEVQVGPAVLVPRPETEQLVGLVLSLIGQVAENTGSGKRGQLKVLDLCTGSGVVGLSLAVEQEELWCLLTDNSREALCVAEMNCRAHREKLRSRVCFYLGDLCLPLAAKPYFEIVVANPPYIAPEDISRLPEEVREFEPVGSLDGGNPQGTGMIARIVETAQPLIIEGGLLALEIGETQQPLIERLFENRRNAFHAPGFHHDLAGKTRFVTAFRK